MLDKCANPECATRFKYLRGGRLFRLSPRALRRGPDGVPTPRRLEYFWLCCRCSASRTLLLDGQDQVSCIPLASPSHAGQLGPKQSGNNATLVSASAWRSIPLWNDVEGGWCCDE